MIARAKLVPNKAFNTGTGYARYSQTGSKLVHRIFKRGKTNVGFNEERAHHKKIKTSSKGFQVL